MSFENVHKLIPSLFLITSREHLLSDFLSTLNNALSIVTPTSHLRVQYYFSPIYHVRIRQSSTQLSCSDTCQIWMIWKERIRCFCRIRDKHKQGFRIDGTDGGDLAELLTNGLLTIYVKLRMHWECRERCPRRRGLAIPTCISDCVTTEYIHN